MAPPDKAKLVPALDRGVRVLDFVARAKAYPTLGEIARELSLAKSSAHTICATLVQLELLIRRLDQSFQLGPHVMRWANAFTNQSDVGTEFAAIWDQESEMPGATITLTVLEGTEVAYIAARNSDVSHSLIDFRVGMRLPAAFTATGKAFLSHMTDAEIRRLFSDGFPAPRTSQSVVSVEDLIHELREVRRRGFSVDNQQVADGIVCFGACVLNSLNRPIAGVAVSLPVERMVDLSKSSIIANVQRIAVRLSHRMGADMEVVLPNDGRTF